MVTSEQLYKIIRTLQSNLLHIEVDHSISFFLINLRDSRYIIIEFLHNYFSFYFAQIVKYLSLFVFINISFRNITRLSIAVPCIWSELPSPIYLINLSSWSNKTQWTARRPGYVTSVSSQFKQNNFTLWKWQKVITEHLSLVNNLVQIHIKYNNGKKYCNEKGSIVICHVCEGGTLKFHRLEGGAYSRNNKLFTCFYYLNSIIEIVTKGKF